MTTISCGGGPTLEQRRAFAGLKDGAHIPGYGGYCPQLKYRIGKTYGQETHELTQERRRLLKPATDEDIAAIRASFQPSDVTKPHYKFLLKHELPASTGDNKYTKEMVPGFTGYVPGMPFLYGGTYRELCDKAIDGLMTKKDNYDQEERTLHNTVASYNKVKPIALDPKVRDLLNQYRDTHPLRPLLIEDRRGLTEAPIPGYRGFVPRVGTTELGLGARYHTASEKGFDSFYRQIASHQRVNQQPVDVKQKITDVTSASKIDVSRAPLSSFGGRRLYQRDGMIPKYTGYIPRRRYVYGDTYGETTRKLSVCNHDAPSYGEHVCRSQQAKSAYF